jgi:hypothetical protein
MFIETDDQPTSKITDEKAPSKACNGLGDDNQLSNKRLIKYYAHKKCFLLQIVLPVHPS